MKGGGFLSLLRQDATVIIRNGYVHVVLGLALLFILLVNFALPQQVEIAGRQYLVDHSQGQLITPLARSAGLAEYLPDVHPAGSAPGAGQPDGLRFQFHFGQCPLQ